MLANNDSLLDLSSQVRKALHDLGVRHVPVPTVVHNFNVVVRRLSRTFGPQPPAMQP
jgi:hypothetical protein